MSTPDTEPPPLTDVISVSPVVGTVPHDGSAAKEIELLNRAIATRRSCRTGPKR